MPKDMTFPLRWPPDRPRTPAREREESRFQVNVGAARDDLVLELKRLGGENCVISTNIPRASRGRHKGRLPADYKTKDAPRDPGVAVYFLLDREPHVYCCDKWTLVEDNIRAISKTIEAMRGIARWGSRQELKRAMSGFKALPPAADDWRSVLQVGSKQVDWKTVKTRYRQLAAAAHPDKGGSEGDMQKLNLALAAAQHELQVR